MKKSLTATYVIKQHHRIVCRIAVQQSDESGLRGFIGIRHFADAELPIGTRLLLDLAQKSIPPHEPNVEEEKIELGEGPLRAYEKMNIDRYRVTVQAITPELLPQIEPDKPLSLHHLSPIHRERIVDRRNMERKPIQDALGQAITCQLLAHMPGLEDMTLTLLEGNLNGLTLVYYSQQPVLGLQPGETRTLRLSYKDQPYQFSGHLVHWITDWHKEEHHLGFKLNPIAESDPRETVLRFLLNPSHTVDISHNEKIDASSGKIRAEVS